MAIAIIVMFVIVLILITADSAKLPKKRHVVAAIGIILTPFIAFKLFECHWYSQTLPEQLEITYPITIGEDSGFREGCGAAVYKLSDKTVQDIQKSGLKFFEKATQGRGHSLDSYYRYESWKGSPVPKEWASEGSWIFCDVIRDKIHQEIILASKKPGSFYTTKPEGKLLVIPSLGYVVFSYFG